MSPQQTRHTPNRPPKSQREFGDWRVELSNPAEAEHYCNPPLSFWKKAQLKIEQLENSRSYGDLWRHSVNVTYTETPETQYNAAEEYDDGADCHLTRMQIHVRRLVAIFILLPLSILLIHALGQQLYNQVPKTAASLNFWLEIPIYYSLIGVCVFLALHFTQHFAPLLTYLYVLGHELTHALTSKIYRSHVHEFNVDLNGGYIETDKDNIVIALTPYFVPLWLLVWIGCMLPLTFFLPEESTSPWFFGGCGFFWTFHVYWTIWIIPREQPDLLENGVLFSLLLIVIINIFILIAILAWFDFITLSGYWADFVNCTKELYDTLSWLVSMAAG